MTSEINARLVPSLICGIALLAGAQAANAEAGDWLLRVRAIAVVPNSSSSDILPSFPGEQVKVDTAFAPEVDVTYFVTKNIGLELIAATTKHSASGRTGTTGSIGKLADTWVLPPTLTAQYHFAPEGKIRPYVGAGLNYTIFYNERASGSLEAAVGPTSAHLSDSFGYALQAGVDVDLSAKMFLNFDVKYIDMDTNARLVTTAAGTQTVRISIDPFVLGVGIGLRF